jgi:hypothetical protein
VAVPRVPQALPGSSAYKALVTEMFAPRCGIFRDSKWRNSLSTGLTRNAMGALRATVPGGASGPTACRDDTGSEDPTDPNQMTRFYCSDLPHCPIGCRSSANPCS